jgi:hypothetical protein
MNPKTKHAGHGAALVASVLLLADTVLLVFMGGGLLRGLSQGASISRLLDHTALPLEIYVAWALGIFGSIAAIAAIVLYGFRERWFWHCLLVASVSWLVFPPIHAVIGLLSLILLVRYRTAFPRRLPSSASPP